ncbi:hypothetical protein FJT64_023596 [Amphibalanus amphitrite]|uniref:Uncharacterized protein n=1 Tax=Amphibalanus amphitrite TaxID=1232801 RepID=A0A6A4W9Z2_AMPAM|nr:hypothetical protein FJT64_023596 [Amphibalanus amphitrite]
MERCCFQFFELSAGVRGLGVLFVVVNLVLLLPVVEDWLQPEGAPVPPVAGGELLLLYRRHRRPLLALAAAAVSVSLPVNVLLVCAAAPGRRPRRRRLLLLPWLVWYAVLFAAGSAAVLAGLAQWARGRLELSAAAALLAVGVLPLCWYWYAAVLALFRSRPSPFGAGDRRSAAADIDCGESAGDPSSVLQGTLSRAVWYWAALNAALMDEQECRRPPPVVEQHLPRRDSSRASLDSLRSAWRRLTGGPQGAAVVDRYRQKIERLESQVDAVFRLEREERELAQQRGAAEPGAEEAAKLETSGGDTTKAGKKKKKKVTG